MVFTQVPPSANGREAALDLYRRQFQGGDMPMVACKACGREAPVLEVAPRPVSRKARDFGAFRAFERPFEDVRTVNKKPSSDAILSKNGQHLDQKNMQF